MKLTLGFSPCPNDTFIFDAFAVIRSIQRIKNLNIFAAELIEKIIWNSMTELSLNKYLALLLAFLMIIVNVIVDHFFAPTGLLLSPVIVIIAVFLITQNKPIPNLFLQAILIFILIAINDIGLKLYGGGIHDGEGQGVLNLLLIVGLLPCFTMLAFTIFRTEDTSIYKKITSISLFISLVCLQLYFFADLGIDRSYL